MLKALTDKPDAYIFRELTQGLEADVYYADRIAMMLRMLQQEGLYSRAHARHYLGKLFRQKLRDVPDSFNDDKVCEHLLRRSLLIHLSEDADKFHLLIFMTRKLFAFGAERCAEEGQDAVMMQEVALAGHTYLALLKDRLANWLNGVRLSVLKQQRMAKTAVRDFKLDEGLIKYIYFFSPRCGC